MPGQFSSVEPRQEQELKAQQIGFRRDGQVTQSFVAKNGQSIVRPSPEAHSAEFKETLQHIVDQKPHKLLERSAEHGPAPTNTKSTPDNPQHVEEVTEKSNQLQAQPAFQHVAQPRPSSAPRLEKR